MHKLKKNTLPLSHDFSSFKCFGPTAKNDAEFVGTKMADLGCFIQRDIKTKTTAADSNKAYFACICQSKTNNNWYVYTEYGRVGNPKVGGFQFWECSSESEAEKIYVKQCESKNVKRGVWKKHPALGKILEPKPNKDLYVVQQLSSRKVQLPDACDISNVATVAVSSKGSNLDIETQKLFADLGTGTADFTRNATVGNILPAQAAIDEVRLLLDECTKITNKLKESSWARSKELKELSTMIYARIPKYKQLKSTDWILTPDQNLLWQQDLNAFESALGAGSYVQNTSLSALNLMKFKYVPKDNELGGWIYSWWPKATANRHSYLGNLKVKNVWYFERVGDSDKLEKYQKSIGKVQNQYQPKFQPKRKDKINTKLYQDTATYSLFHGTRSVNVASIIKQSLKLPKELSRSQITGGLFGSSTYWASDIKKSVGYTSYKGSYWSKGAGGLKGRGSFMFIADVALGKMYRCKYGYTSGPPSGYHSVYAQAGYSGVQNDEHMVFDTNGFKLRYLVEFE